MASTQSPSIDVNYVKVALAPADADAAAAVDVDNSGVDADCDALEVTTQGAAVAGGATPAEAAAYEAARTASLISDIGKVLSSATDADMAGMMELVEAAAAGAAKPTEESIALELSKLEKSGSGDDGGDGGEKGGVSKHTRALLEACQYGTLDARKLKRLLKAGADKNALDAGGNTPYMIALAKEDEKAQMLLKEHGCVDVAFLQQLWDQRTAAAAARGGESAISEAQRMKTEIKNAKAARAIRLQRNAQMLASGGGSLALSTPAQMAAAAATMAAAAAAAPTAAPGLLDLSLPTPTSSTTSAALSALPTLSSPAAAVSSSLLDLSLPPASSPTTVTTMETTATASGTAVVTAAAGDADATAAATAAAATAAATAEAATAASVVSAAAENGVDGCLRRMQGRDAAAAAAARTGDVLGLAAGSTDNAAWRLKLNKRLMAAEPPQRSFSAWKQLLERLDSARQNEVDLKTKALAAYQAVGYSERVSR
jgi:hypothetical protein